MAFFFALAKGCPTNIIDDAVTGWSYLCCTLMAQGQMRLTQLERQLAEVGEVWPRTTSIGLEVG